MVVAEKRLWYWGVYAEVEGMVVVAELNFFSFVSEGRTSDGGPTTNSRRTSGYGWTSGAWAISGTG